MKLDREHKRGSAEMLILSLVEERPRHGYEILKLLEERSGGVLRFHIGSVYPILKIGHNDEMPVSVDTLRLQLDYSAWATQRLLDVAAKLPPEELTRDFQTSDKCVLDTLVHIYAADRIWLSRVLAEPRATFVDPEDRDLTLLQTEWPALHQRWKLWMRDFSDADVAEKISFEDMRGNPHAKPVWQIVLHVVNHGTHHRGQVSGFLRAMRHTPPPLDLMEYYMTL